MLDGGGGHDGLLGDGGSDTLTGGDGDDGFYFHGSWESSGDDHDVIMDFGEGDRLHLTWLEGFDAVTQEATAEGLMVMAGDFKVLLAGYDGTLDAGDFTF